MKIDILTLFPEMYTNIFNTSIIKRAIDNNLVEINIINFRDYSKDSHNKVDDTPYGGGSGMVLRIEPIYDAINAIKTKDSKVVLLSPTGSLYKQEVALKLSRLKHLILICGHYEGFDERINNLVDYSLSIGDYILTGGEIPSMVIVDSVTRLLDGAITKESLDSESFNDNLLDYPVYTKPREFKGMKVPDVLLSGNHQKIEIYRREQQIKKTKENRSDLLVKGSEIDAKDK